MIGLVLDLYSPLMVELRRSPSTTTIPQSSRLVQTIKVSLLLLDLLSITAVLLTHLQRVFRTTVQLSILLPLMLLLVLLILLVSLRLQEQDLSSAVVLYSQHLVQQRQSPLMKNLQVSSDSLPLPQVLVILTDSAGMHPQLQVLCSLSVVESKKSPSITVIKLSLVAMTMVALLLLQIILPTTLQMVWLQNLSARERKIITQFFIIRQLIPTMVELDLSLRSVIREHHLLKKTSIFYCSSTQIMLLLRQVLFLKLETKRHKNSQVMLSTNLHSPRLVLVLYSQLVEQQKQLLLLNLLSVYSVYLDLLHTLEQDLSSAVVLYSHSTVLQNLQLGIITRPRLLSLHLLITATLLVHHLQVLITLILVSSMRRQPMVRSIMEQSSILLQYTH